MSFNIVLMNNHDPYNKISKNPVTVRTISGTLRDETSIVDPDILIEYNGTLTDCNYAYIAEFSRYYFIKNIESVRTKLWRVSMHCDVLKTFSEGILGSPCIVARSSDRFNLYLNDAHYKAQQNPIIFTKKFPSGFDLTNATFVLGLIGGREAGVHSGPVS